MILITNSSKPYVNHIPTFLAAPKGVCKLFRYAKLWVDDAIIDSKIDNMLGIIYLRNRDIGKELCIPIRKFKVVGKKMSGPVIFLNCELLDIVDYDALGMKGDDEIVDRLEKCESPSASVLLDEINFRKKRNEDIPIVWDIYLPAEGEPQIKPYSYFKPYDENKHKLVRVTDDSEIVNSIRKKSSDRKSEVDAWWRQIGIYPWYENLSEVNFWHVRTLRNLRQEDSECEIEELSKPKKSWKHSKGYKLYPGRQYIIEIEQANPSFFVKSLSKQFLKYSFSMNNSDMGIDVISKPVRIDGKYGHYELSFEVSHLPRKAIPLLRLECFETDVEEENSEFPPLEIAIKLKQQVFRTICLAFIGIISVGLFVFAELLLGLLFTDVNTLVLSITRLITLSVAILIGGRFRSLSFVKSIARQ